MDDLLIQIDNIKQKISDKEYLKIMKTLQKINEKNDIYEFEYIETDFDRVKKTVDDEEYELLKIIHTRKKILTRITFECEEFDISKYGKFNEYDFYINIHCGLIICEKDDDNNILVGHNDNPFLILRSCIPISLKKNTL